MKTPPMLMLATLLFWGWETGLPIWGVAMGMALEASNWTRWRLDFSNKEFHRVWDLCALLFFAVGIYLRFTEQTGNYTYYFFQWLPIVFLPMALAQAFGNRETVPYSAFSWFMRRRKIQDGKGLNLSWIYFALCFVAAGAANRRDRWYYLGLAALGGAALLSHRPRRFPPLAWAVSFGAVVAMGYFAHIQINQIQNFIEGRASEWFSKFARKDFDPSETRTSMGRIGSLKESGRIVLKVKPVAGTPSELLRQASYNLLKDATWTALKPEFVEAASDADLSVWTLLAEKRPTNLVEVSGYLAGGKGVLSLPLGSCQVSNLPAAKVEINRFGAARVSEGPGFYSYLAGFGPGQSAEAPPEPEDKAEGVPEKDRPALESVAQEIGLSKGEPTALTLEKIQRFFQGKFRYTLYLKRPHRWLAPKRSFVSEFLLDRREGHCEYFASATVLLLRSLDIPARYATGYSVQERAKRGEGYVVRERHAHAWTLAWFDGAWHDFDTTPASWGKEEANEASIFEPIGDFFANLRFAFSKWRWTEKKDGTKNLAAGLIAALILYLVWRIVWGRKGTRAAPAGGAKSVAKGGDSEFYLVETYLQKQGLARPLGEPLLPWVVRLRATRADLTEGLEAIVRLHYRHRFDPRGLTAAERTQLKTSVAKWLDKTGKH